MNLLQLQTATVGVLIAGNISVERESKTSWEWLQIHYAKWIWKTFSLIAVYFSSLLSKVSAQIATYRLRRMRILAFFFFLGGGRRGANLSFNEKFQNFALEHFPFLLFLFCVFPGKNFTLRAKVRFSGLCIIWFFSNLLSSCFFRSIFAFYQRFAATRILAQELSE